MARKRAPSAKVEFEQLPPILASDARKCQNPQDVVVEHSFTLRDDAAFLLLLIPLVHVSSPCMKHAFQTLEGGEVEDCQRLPRKSVRGARG